MIREDLTQAWYLLPSLWRAGLVVGALLLVAWGALATWSAIGSALEAREYRKAQEAETERREQLQVERDALRKEAESWEAEAKAKALEAATLAEAIKQAGGRATEIAETLDRERERYEEEIANAGGEVNPDDLLRRLRERAAARPGGARRR